MSVAEILGGFSRGLFSPRTADVLIEALRRRSGLAHCWPVSSGRAAMTIILKAMRETAKDPQRDEVIIPAYTCYSVAASVARAGLRPRLCDVDPGTLGMDPEALDRCDFSRVLAVVSANLYGIPNRLADIEQVARRRGVFMLDDSAQALGARLGNRAVGAFGDAGLYSFDKGKIICTIQGGAIVSRGGPLATTLAAHAEALPPSATIELLLNAIKLPIYAICIRPTLYGVVRRLPFLGLGRTEYEPRYPIARLSGLQTGVASGLAGRLDSLNDQRRANARKLADALAGLPQTALPQVAADAIPVYARFPMRVLQQDLRARLLAALDAAGIGASSSYPQSLADVPEIAAQLRTRPDVPGAREIANQIVTLPTHGYCPPDIGQRVRKTYTECLRA